jgi:hypothetical protein
MTMNGRSEWWFPKKKYGFGWGLPTRWQGWAALAAFLVSIGIGLPLAGEKWGSTGRLVAGIGFSIALIVTCLIKGEPLRRHRDDGAHADGDTDADDYTDPSTSWWDRNPKGIAYLLAAVTIPLSIPLALKMVPRNASYGFRVPSTLSGTSAHWYHVNQVAGIAMIGAGITTLLLAMLIDRNLDASAQVRRWVISATALVLLTAASFAPFWIT